MPLAEDMLPILHRWFNSSEACGAFDAPLIMSWDVFQKRYETGQFRNLRMAFLEDSPIGWADVNIFREYPASAGITVHISEPKLRGCGFGRKIHELLISEFLISNPEIRWLEAWTHVLNLAEQRILEGIGFERDKSTTKQFVINGQLADFYAYEFEVKA